MTLLRAKYVRDLAIRGRAERTQETYTSTSVIWRAYHICQLKDEHMLTLARLRTDAACDSLRFTDATRYSYKPQTNRRCMLQMLQAPTFASLPQHGQKLGLPA